MDKPSFGRLNIIVLMCGAVTAGIGIITLLGWMANWLVLARIEPRYIPMAPNTALLFFLLGSALLITVLLPSGHKIRYSLPIIAWFSFTLSGVTLVGFLFGVDIGIDKLLFRTTEMLGAVPVGYMSPITAFCFILAGAALFLFWRRLLRVSAILGSFITVIAAVILLGYFYGAPLLYGGTVIPVALPTALAFVMLGVGIVARAGNQVWPLTAITGNSTYSRLLRGILPAVVLVMIIEDWIIARMLGNVDSNMVLISSVISILALGMVGLILFRISKTIGKSIDFAEHERAVMEIKLRESNQRLQAVIHASPLAIVAIDTDGHVTMWSRSAERIFGWKEKEVLGKLPLYVPLDKQEEFCRVRRRIIQEKAEFTGVELVRQKKDGSAIDVNLSAAPLYDDKGNVSGMIGVLADITEKKRLEAELIKIQKLESIGILAGGIAHDFNNILTTIIGDITLARMNTEYYDKEKIMEKLAAAEKACSRARDLSNQLLTFAKGGVPIKKTISIRKLLIENVSFALSGSNVRCACSLPDDLWPILADEAQMIQVIDNLMLNAKQAMPEGGKILVNAANTAIAENNILPPGQYVKISITDEGKGIAPEYLSKIFDPYFTTKPKGSGLGLAIGYSIIKRHGGYITVASKPGQGTTVDIYLPKSEETAVKAEGKGKIFSGRGKVLLMDDDEDIRQTVGEEIRKMGYAVALAKDGPEMIALYKQAKSAGQPFAAVIMDLTIPGSSGGKEFARELLQLDPQARAIVSSGYSKDPVMANFKDYGFSAVLTKPYDICELSRVLYQALSVK